MIEALGGVIGSIGLFFMGTWLLTENLKVLITRRVRLIAVNWVPNHYVAWGWGALSGAIIQNMAALTFIAVSLLRTNLLSMKRAFAFILGGNMGGGVLVLVVSLDIKLAAFFVLGAASLLIVSERGIRFRNVVSVLFGLALMIVALGLLKEFAASLAGQGVFDEFMKLGGRSLWLTFLGAAALAFVVQSSLVVIVLAVGMGAVGAFTNDQVYISVFGAYAGMTVIHLGLSWSLTGEASRVAMFQAFYNLLVILTFVPLLCIELWSGAPLVKALVLAIPMEQPLAFLPLVSDALIAIPAAVLLPPAVGLFPRLSSATAAETMSRTLYIHDRSYGNVATALELIALEQRRVISAFSLYLDAVRQGSGIVSLGNSVRTLIREIDEFFTEVRLRHPGHAVDDVNSMLAQQRLIAWLEEQFAELCAGLNELPSEGSAGQLRDSLVEGIDTVVVVIVEELTSPDPERWSMVAQLTGDRSDLLRRIRNSYMSVESPPSDAVQEGILKITNTAAEIFFLFSRLTQEMRNSPVLNPAPPASPPLQ